MYETCITIVYMYMHAHMGIAKKVPYIQRRKHSCPRGFQWLHSHRKYLWRHA